MRRHERERPQGEAVDRQSADAAWRKSTADRRASPSPRRGEGWGEGVRKQLRARCVGGNVSDRISTARRLRKNQTDAERILWLRRRDRRLTGLKFRRQVPIDRYVVDFF